MTFLIAAAGTGGHVFPGLAVGEGLLAEGVPRSEVVYVGGSRLESRVYPDHGFRFVQLELAGLRRSLTAANLRLPALVIRARRAVSDLIRSLEVKVVLGMGGYVTIPVALAAQSRRVAFFNAEQNAEAGLANRVAARWARATFASFPETGGLSGALWVGNPVRREFWSFDRASLRPAAREHYGLAGEARVLGVVGGSLGALALNHAVAALVESWKGPEMSVVHLVGEAHLEDMMGRGGASTVTWKRIGFEPDMTRFFAAVDLVAARAGGSVAELTATATPALLVPGSFGSGGHQEGNARYLARVGAAEVIPQVELDRLGDSVHRLISDRDRLAAMSAAAREVAKPEAALTIARTMIEAAR